MRAFGEVLVENRKRKGYSQADLVDLLAQEGIEVTTKAVSKWENLTREPSLHTILTVCQILDIEDIYEEFLGENPFDHVMENLNEDGKAKIIEFANLLRASRKYLPHRADIIPFENYQPIAVEPASAGTGNYIEDSVKESYNVGHLAPEKTDFGIRISGDSMEPMYHTGDVAWVHKQDKELHVGPDVVYLVSLYEKYLPIQIFESDSFKIFGKVIGKCKGAEIPGFH